MTEIPDNLQYTETHEWIRNEGKVAVIGITDFAQEELHEIVFVELPEAGFEVKKGEEFAAVESVKARSEIYAPANGRIININRQLVEGDEPARPELINEDPYGQGWLVKLEVSDPGELEGLQTAEEYSALVSKSRSTR